MEPVSQTLEQERGWQRLRWLLIALLVCRGFVFLCVLPPFEGWDEYQHVGYLVHIVATGHTPILGQTLVPREVVTAVIQYPQSRSALEQLGPLGGASYAKFWDRPAGVPVVATGAIALYQAQHGALYYRLMAPLFRLAGGTADVRSSVACLRFSNLLFLTGAVWIALGTVRRLVRSPRDAGLIGILIGLHPLYLMNGLRVANDALGVLLATAAIGLGLSLERRRLVMRCAALGVLAGLAVRAKAVHVGLCPFIAVVLCVGLTRTRVSLARGILAVAATVVLGLLVLAPELRWNLATYGALTPMQEALHNRAAGRTAFDLVHAAIGLDWKARIERLWTRDLLVQGGWSFLGPGPTIMRWHAKVVLIALLGWAWHVTARSRRNRFIMVGAGGAVACLTVCLGYTAALAYHMAQSQLAWGQPTTAPWYACAAIPAYLTLVAAGALAWPLGRFREIGLIMLGLLFCLAEWRVIWVTMVPTYAGGATLSEALRRIAALEPAWLGTPTLFAASAGVIVTLAAAILTWTRMGSRPRFIGSQHAGWHVRPERPPVEIRWPLASAPRRRAR
jgi:hypothetical protein